jgi:arginyl-tRNA synthetase
MNLLTELQSRFRAALTTMAEDAEPFVAMVRPSQNSKFGDFQANCAMSLAKERNAKPRDVAAEIVERLDVADLCEPPEIAGPGPRQLGLDRCAARPPGRHPDRAGHA